MTAPARGLAERLAVLGSGSWGTMIAHLGALGGREVALWGRDPAVADELRTRGTNARYLGQTRLAPAIRPTTDLGEAVAGAALVVFAVPSAAFREVAAAAGAFVTGDQALLSATKGLEPVTRDTMSRVLRDETCAKKVGALSGPNLAKEILQGQPSATVVASRYRDVIRLAARLLHGPLFRLYGNDDLLGVELAGALKNVIAIAAGVAHGLGFGANVRALLVTRGLAEVQRLGVKLGAQPLTFSGLAGVGDLMVTCGSELSRNFRVGQGLAKGRALDEVVAELGEVAEGINTTRVALALARDHAVAMPITEAVGRLLFEGLTPQAALEDLMTRAARYEIDFDYAAEVG